MLLTYFSFDQKDAKPFYLIVNNSGEVEKKFINFSENLTMRFDTEKRYCIGGHEIGTSENWACPDGSEVDKKYEQCKKCMDKTGFNPAFYNTSEISDKQAEYNKQPHNLYLAYFDEKNIKVGISHSHRGNARLLEQGARAAIILDQFGSANVARQYEAMVSKLSGIQETLTVAKKMDLLKEDFNFEIASKRLLEEKKRIEGEVKVEFSGSEVLDLDKFYGDTSDLRDLNDMTEAGMISGEVVACVGCLLVARNGDDKLVLPVKKFTGYEVEISGAVETVELAPKQFSLF